MSKRKLFLFLILAIIIPNSLLSAKWSIKEANLMTEWANEIDTLNVLNEYPRPQLVRSNWLNLNGVWDFQKDNAEFGSYNIQQTFNQRILVPFPIESAISGIMDEEHETNQTSVFTYRRHFELSEDFTNQELILHFGAVDWECAVFVDGTKVGSHKGGYTSFSFPISEAINTTKDTHELVVQVKDPTDQGGQPKGKQATYPGGIFYTPTSGIWQTVWLEPVHKTHLKDITITPDIDKEEVSILLDIDNLTADLQVSISVLFDDNVVASLEKKSLKDSYSLKVSKPNLWTPENPHLYDLNIKIENKTHTLDEVTSYFGMRKISKVMIDGHPAFTLNNKPIFQLGVLDQGYWPDGLYTAPSDEALVYDIVTAKELGFNMIRKHVKVEPSRWYYHCDRLGVLVWQDIPSAQDHGNIGTKQDVQNNFYKETSEIVDALKNHPSIITWVVFNEGWGQDASSTNSHTINGVKAVEEIDTSRLINAVSGWVDFEFGDIIDKHQYPRPAVHENPIRERVSVCGEYGGISLFINNHTWKGSGHEYVSVINKQELKNLYVSYLKDLKGLQQKGLWGAIYTQLTDVEEEINGLITYDRKEVKLTSSHIEEIKSEVNKIIDSRYVSIMESADVSDSPIWKYTTTNPGRGWQTEEFDDNEWKEGFAGFGAGGPPNSHIQTSWNNDEIYLRRNFTLDNVNADDLSNLKLWVYHDEDCDIYLNGVLAARKSSYVTNYQVVDISASALNALNLDGDNLIAVKCLQTWGGQYIDVGITMEKEVNSLSIEPMYERPEEPVVIEQDSVYLMSYFRGSPQHLFYAYSYDGLKWEDLNYGEPIFDAYDKNIWLRDPFVKRVTHRGETKFHMVHTWGWDNPAIFHWESTDLITWKAANGGITNDDGKIYVMDGKNGNPKAPNAWAPEFSYDAETETFYIYWSSNVGGGYQKHHYCTTQDWINFTPSKVYFDPGFTAIDLTILEYDGMYYGYYKDERWGQKKTRLATSSSLDPNIDTFRGSKEMLSSGYTVEVEGPATFKAIGQDKWFLYWDKFIHDMGVSYAYSYDPSSNKWYMVPDDEVKNPTQVKHGSVEIISIKELNALLAHFNKERIAIVPTSDIEPQEWKYTTEMPFPGWYRMQFNDNSWETGFSGFGEGDAGQGVINTAWEGSEIYIRKKFHIGDLSDEEMENIFLRICYDDDATVYINGIQAMVLNGHTKVYLRKELKESVMNSFKKNSENIIAVKCVDKGGVKYIDAGLFTNKDEEASSVIENKENVKKKFFFDQERQTLNVNDETWILNSSIVLYDVAGRKVYETRTKSINLTPNLEHGVYIAQLHLHSENKIITKVFVK